jgi:hypothetical protein
MSNREQEDFLRTNVTLFCLVCALAWVQMISLDIVGGRSADAPAPAWRAYIENDVRRSAIRTISVRHNLQKFQTSRCHACGMDTTKALNILLALYLTPEKRFGCLPLRPWKFQQGKGCYIAICVFRAALMPCINSNKEAWKISSHDDMQKWLEETQKDRFPCITTTKTRSKRPRDVIKFQNNSSGKPRKVIQHMLEHGTEGSQITKRIMDPGVCERWNLLLAQMLVWFLWRHPIERLLSESRIDYVEIITEDLDAPDMYLVGQGALDLPP